MSTVKQIQERVAQKPPPAPLLLAYFPLLVSYERGVKLEERARKERRE